MIKSKETLKNIIPYQTDKYYSEWTLKLDSNENAYGAFNSVIDSIKNFDPNKIKYYPAYGALLDKLASLTNSIPDNFILTNGCDEAINLVLSAFLDKNDEVLSYSPTFSMPELYCSIIGAKFKKIKYNNRWEFSLSDFISNIDDRVKILYLTSPNNPTGDVIQKKDIENLLTTYKDKLVLLDCTYFNYSSYNIQDYFSLVNRFDNLAILKSFSKDYALAGFRLGYIYSSPLIINEVKKVISPYSVNACALNSGLVALNNRNEFEEIRLKINKSKEKLVAALNSMGFRAYNTEANFILCDFGEYADFIYNKLLTKNIKVKYFKGIEGLENTFRITAPRLEDVDKLIDAIKPRDLLVFDLDGVVFDVKKSYREAIKKTYNYFTKLTLDDVAIQEVKNLGSMSNDWDVTEFLIKKAGVKIDYNQMVKVFQDFFFVPNKVGSKGLIDNEENVLDKSFFDKILEYADCAVFTGRPCIEAFYSLEKFGIKKCFSYFICNEDVDGNYKPSPYGLNKIKKNTTYKKILYFGDTVDDIKAGVDASVDTYGIIPPCAPNPETTKQKMFEMGAINVFDNKKDLLNSLIKGDMICKQ